MMASMTSAPLTGIAHAEIVSTANSLVVLMSCHLRMVLYQFGHVHHMNNKTTANPVAPVMLLTSPSITLASHKRYRSLASNNGSYF